MNGLEIKKIRKKLGMTQAEFAKLLGVSSRTVINWEKEATTPIVNDELMKLISHYENQNFGGNGVKNESRDLNNESVTIPMSVMELLLSQQRTIENLSKKTTARTVEDATCADVVG